MLFHAAPVYSDFVPKFQ